jgi:integrase/recombinase XerD
MTTKIREIKLKNNQIGVMLDMHQNGKRTQKMLKIRYCDIPKDSTERQDKKQKKELVKKMVAKIELDSLYTNNVIEKEYQLDKNFFDYCQEFIDAKPHTNTRHYHTVIRQLKKFTKRSKLICSEIDEAFLSRFKDYLNAHLNGVSAYNYYKNLKKIIKEATYHRHFTSNPTERIVNSKGKSRAKETLTNEGMLLLTETLCSNEEVKNAFLFSCLTGLRFCDVSNLKWENIKTGVIDIIQRKTKERLILKLHDDTIHLIGKQKRPQDLIFNLPSHTSCLTILKSWVEDAQIEKHITWHCSRHSFATALILENENITTVSKLLGHKSIIETQGYVRVAEMSKENAINKLPSIFKSK